MRKLFILLLCFMLSFSLGQFPAQAASVGTIGKPVIQEGYNLTVNEVKTGQNDSGEPYVAVDVTLASESDQGVSANLLYAKLKSDSGYVYTPTFFGVQPALNSMNDLPKGERVRGWITFQIPNEEDSSNYTFEYQAIRLLGNSPRLRVKLDS
ncbi:MULTISPECIES: DUF4352 domain-containing protein [Microcoleaceae]|uniref:DUF4352 domain-containing protein n=1 Tax=Microcoleaceae TaxID=1892252 RepID=UPI00223832B6|nr:DUF4352 domain-containing protein [Lyngbya sp. CCAP 1446/10]MCW6051480.1 DUF4352 domain-containing protein [Lyngbya sp. CCAP 1446/10]